MERIFLACAELVGSDRGKTLMGTWTDPKLPVEDKVEFLLNYLRDGLYIILCDNVEDLLDDEQRIIDQGLRVFFEIALKTTNTTRLLITSRETIKLPTEIMRFDQHIILTDGLPIIDAIAMLRDLDPNNEYGLHQASEDDLSRLAELVHGVPRALEAIASILAHDPFANLSELLEYEELYRREQFVNELVRENYKRLDPDSRRVMDVLAVLARPAPLIAVEFMLIPIMPGVDLNRILRKLISTHTVSIDRHSKTVFLHPIDRDYIYSQLPENGVYNRNFFERRAANYYAQFHVPKENWNSLADLEAHLQEFGHLIKAKEYETAAALLNDIGEYPLLSWGYAQRLLDMGETLPSKVTLPAAQISLLNLLGDACMHLGKYEQGLKFREDFLDLAVSQGDEGMIAQALQKVGHAFSNLSQYQKAIEYQTKSLTHARNTGNKDSEWEALRVLGMAYRNLGHPDQAISYFESAMEIAQLLKDAKKEGMVLESLAVVYRNVGRYEESRTLLERALEIAQRLGIKKEEAKALGNLGSAHAALGNWEDAIYYSKKTILLCDEISYPRQAGYAYECLGMIHLSLKQPDEALTQFEKSRTIHHDIGNILGQMQAISGMAAVYLSTQQYAQSEDYLRQTIHAARQLNNRHEMGRHLILLGDVFIATNQTEDAIQVSEEALKIFTELANNTMMQLIKDKILSAR